MNTRHMASWAAVFLVGSVLFPWYNVPTIAAVCGWYSLGRRPVITAAAGAALAWVVLLVVAALTTPIGSLGAVLSGVMKLPAVLIYAITIAFPALLGGSAAALAAGVRGRLEDRR